MSPALRIAYRDALRSRGRSLLVLVMIALPVLGVTAADVLIHTSDVNTTEGLDRRLGSADALVTPTLSRRVFQAADPNGAFASRGVRRTPTPVAQVQALLGGDRPVLEYHEGSTRVRTGRGAADVGVIEVDLRAPLAQGLSRLTSGRLPATTDEVVVNQALLSRGLAVGDRLELADGEGPRIVGTAESTNARTWRLVFGLPGSVVDVPDNADGPSWLVGGGPVDWSQVREVNQLGVSVVSRAVLLDPPTDAELPPQVQGAGPGGTDPAVVAVAVLVATMALLEVVLLAGPAFAVGARRQSRTLALLAASGGTPRQARRVILAGGLVLGGVASVLGVVLGIGAARLAQPFVQGVSGSWFGPFEVPWLQLLGVGAFGLLSALLAAVVPAFIASRQDVVAVLAGRRGDRPPSARSPLVGLLLLGAGVAGSWWGAKGGGEYAIAVSALVAVLGMILVVPVVLAGLARLGSRLPLSLRYAVRDAARHRTRTVPAVAAVAATVAGVVALGIGGSSDEAQNRGEYVASLPMGLGVLSSYAEPEPDWDRVAAAVRAQLPDAETEAVRGVLTSVPGQSQGSLDLGLGVPGDPYLLSSWSDSAGASLLVSRSGLPAALDDLGAPDRARAAAVLRRGGVVAFTDHAVDADRVRLRARVYDSTGRPLGPTRRTSLPAVFLRYQGTAPAIGVISPQAAAAAGLRVGEVSLTLRQDGLTTDQQQDVQEAVAAIDPDVNLYVERGYQTDDDVKIMLLVLGALGAVLMLGGTLTATFLALSDARPDLATLAAVGAAPRTRRAVAAAYAVVVGLVGAVLGAVVGFVPGVAITYPLTSNSWMSGEPQSHYLVVPWLLIATLVVALPLLTAAVVGLTARSRLPLVARLD